MGEKILAAMSGGVDSSAICGILKDNGYDVYGATLYMFDDLKTGEECENGKKNSSDAKSVADLLGFEHISVNVADTFKKYVIENFVREYEIGSTPNPCVECNKYIKFKKMIEIADKANIKYIATGHYAKVAFDDNSGRYLLKKANDPLKDQSYVLYSLTQDILARVIFPLGDISKPYVKEYAKQHNMITADRPESQDICFIPDGDYGKFLRETMGVKPIEGNFVDINGNILGKHDGIINYTIGQRRGLGGGFSSPMYVIAKDEKTNNVVLGSHDMLFSDTMMVNGINWISIEKLTQPLKAEAKIRYSSNPVGATLYPLEDGRVKVIFDKPQRAITRGQSAVFYDGDIVIGGGKIE